MKTNIELAREAGLSLARDEYPLVDRYTALVEQRMRDRLMAGSAEPVVIGQIRIKLVESYSSWQEINEYDVDRKYREGVETRRVYQFTADQLAAERLKRQEAQAECERLKAELAQAIFGDGCTNKTIEMVEDYLDSPIRARSQS